MPAWMDDSCLGGRRVQLVRLRYFAAWGGYGFPPCVGHTDCVWPGITVGAELVNCGHCRGGLLTCWLLAAVKVPAVV
jgi:hypothetical protein